MHILQSFYLEKNSCHFFCCSKINSPLCMCQARRGEKFSIVLNTEFIDWLLALLLVKNQTCPFYSLFWNFFIFLPRKEKRRRTNQNSINSILNQFFETFLLLVPAAPVPTGKRRNFNGRIEILFGLTWNKEIFPLHIFFQFRFLKFIFFVWEGNFPSKFYSGQ